MARQFKNIRDGDPSGFGQHLIQSAEGDVGSGAAVKVTLDRIPGVKLHAGILPDISAHRVAVPVHLGGKRFGGHFSNIALTGIHKEKDGTFFLVIIISGFDEFFQHFRRLFCSVAV